MMLANMIRKPINTTIMMSADMGRTANTKAKPITTITTRYWDKDEKRYIEVNGPKKAKFFINQITTESKSSIPYLLVDSVTKSDNNNEFIYKEMFDEDTVQEILNENIKHDESQQKKLVALPKNAVGISTIRPETAQAILEKHFCWDNSPDNDVVLFVHGFNTSMDGAKKSAEYICDAVNTNSTKPIRVVIFDWASTHTKRFEFFQSWIRDSIIAKFIPSIAKNYAQDSESAQASVRPLVWLLYVLIASKYTGKLHIIGHSMGTKIVAAAIKTIINNYEILNAINYDHIDNQKNNISKIKLLIFKQADMDIVNMAETLAATERIRKIVGATDFCIPVIFAHPKDGPLNVSKDIHAGIERVGLFTADTVKKYVELETLQKYILGEDLIEKNWKEWLFELKNGETDDDIMGLLDRLNAIPNVTMWNSWMEGCVGIDDFDGWNEELSDAKAEKHHIWLSAIHKTLKQEKYPRSRKRIISILTNANRFFSKEERPDHSYFKYKKFQQLLFDSVNNFDPYTSKNGQLPIPTNLSEVLLMFIRIYQYYIQDFKFPLSPNTIIELRKNIQIQANLPQLPNRLTSMNLQQNMVLDVDIYETLNAII